MELQDIETRALLLGYLGRTRAKVTQTVGFSRYIDFLDQVSEGWYSEGSNIVMDRYEEWAVGQVKEFINDMWPDVTNMPALPRFNSHDMREYAEWIITLFTELSATFFDYGFALVYGSWNFVDASYICMADTPGESSENTSDLLNHILAHFNVDMNAVWVFTRVWNERIEWPPSKALIDYDTIVQN